LPNGNCSIEEIVDFRGHVYSICGPRVEGEFPVVSGLRNIATLRAVGYDLVDNMTAIDDADRSLSFTCDRLDRVETAATTGSPFQPDVTLVSGHDAVGNRCPFRKLDPDQGVVQAAEVRDELDLTTSLDLSREWCVFA